MRYLPPAPGLTSTCLDTGSHSGGAIRFGFCPNANGLDRVRLIEILPDRMGSQNSACNPQEIYKR